METRVVKINEKKIGPQEEAYLKEAGRIVRNGGLVVFPTETVYGLGADAFNAEAARRIYAAKGRPSDNPLIVHIADMKELDAVCAWPDASTRIRALLIAERFWPGPVTMILHRNVSLPGETTGGLKTVAVRCPANEIARRLILRARVPIAAPSANRSGRPSPTDAKYCVEDLDGRVDMIIDGGESPIGLESTIVDLCAERARILRPGIVPVEDVRDALKSVGGAVLDAQTASDETGAKDDRAPEAPGMKYRHYAPKGEMRVVEGASQQVVAYINEAIMKARGQKKKTGVVVSDETAGLYQADVVKNVGSRQDGDEIARRLFRALREMDEEAVDVVYAEAFTGTSAASAIMNRLYKAAGGQIVRL